MRPSRDDELDRLLTERLQAQVSEQRKRAAELTSLYDLALRLSGVHELNALLQDTVTHAKSLLGVDVAYLALAEPDDTLVIMVTDGSIGPRLRGVRLRRRCGLAGRVADLAEPVQVRDYLGDPELQHLGAVDSVAVAEGLRAILGAPLRLRGTFSACSWCPNASSAPSRQTRFYCSARWPRSLRSRLTARASSSDTTTLRRSSRG